MKKFFAKGIVFLKENPSIIYSLVLVVIIPFAFFINTYIINSKYEKNIDAITQRKAAMMESIINNLIKDKLENLDVLQRTLDDIKKDNNEIIAISIMMPKGQGGFVVSASSEHNLVGDIQENSVQNTMNTIAWNSPEGLAFLDSNGSERFWKITKMLVGENGEKIGLIAASFSLRDTDEIISETIYSSYRILIIIILLVVLLVANQGRILGYAFMLSKLKEIDKMKDMFISMASHELRTPLTAIKGYADMLKESKDSATEEEKNHYISNIASSANRLQDLVNDMLDVSRIEGNRMPMELKIFNPVSVIAECVDELQVQVQAKNLKLTYSPDQTSAEIEADENRLKQVVINIIGNSIKYTEKGSIEVTTQIKDKDFLIIVADTGIGMSSEAQANLFQKFYRIQNERTKGIVGTGLGLWITQEITKRMKGKITVESIEGVGSHFMIHFPIAKK